MARMIRRPITAATAAAMAGRLLDGGGVVGVVGVVVGDPVSSVCCVVGGGAMETKTIYDNDQHLYVYR